MAADKSAEVPLTSNKREISGRGGVRRTTSGSRGKEGQGLKKVFKVAQTGATGLVALAALRGGVALEGDVENSVAKMETGVHRLIGDQHQDTQPEVVDKRIPSEFELIYPGLEGQEKWNAFVNYLAEQKVVQDNYIGGPDHSEEFKAVAKYEDKIRTYAKEFQVPENLLIGLVTIESKGDPYAVSKAGAKGLTQMMDDMAKAHNLKISEVDTKDPNYDPMTDLGDERFDADLNLREAAKEIATAYEYWEDWGLAFWEWHAGRPNVYLAIQLYVDSESKGLDVLQDIRDAQDADQSTQIKKLYMQKIKDYQVNLDRLLRNEKVIAKFSEPGYDLTLDYVPRLLAAGVYFEKNLDQIR